MAKRTAKQWVAELRSNTDALYAKTASFEQFTARQAEMWGAIELSPAMKRRVSALLRERSAA